MRRQREEGGVGEGRARGRASREEGRLPPAESPNQYCSSPSRCVREAKTIKRWRCGRGRTRPSSSSSPSPPLSALLPPRHDAPSSLACLSSKSGFPAKAAITITLKKEGPKEGRKEKRGSFSSPFPLPLARSLARN